ncbi:hypothetical protein SDC9_68430 [bioreactor metagenome]|uniref:Uncharacterized protein n=1 Tax=bioreactor metagenome TaxID=1076179 RepID=A0A644Y0E6_9ZZZZ
MSRRNNIVQGEPGIRVDQIAFQDIGSHLDLRGIQVDGQADVPKRCHHVAAADEAYQGAKKNEGYDCQCCIDFFHDCFLEVEAHASLDAIQGRNP